MRSNAKLNRRLVAQYQKWMVAMHYATVTKSMYLKVLNSFLIFLGERSLIRVTHTDIRLFIADASENGATLSTVYRSLGVLRQFYDFLNLGGVVDYVAPRFVRLRVPWRNSLRVLNQEQVRRVISATRTRREKALIEFFYSSGCRLSEAIHLKIQDIDFQARQARVRGKLGKVRLVLIAESAANALLAYIGARKNGYVFETDYAQPKGHFSVHEGRWKSRWKESGKDSGSRVYRMKTLGSVRKLTYSEAKRKHEALIAGLDLTPIRRSPLSKMAVQAMVAGVGRRAGLKRITPHVFRRTFATHLHENGASLEVIRALLGHVWIQTTLRYAKIGPDGLMKSFERCHPLGNKHENQSD
jgi:site-specific recombinase XerD